MSRRQLATALGVDEKALRDWETRPDAPKDRTVEAWQPYIEANHLAKGMTRASYAQLREEKIREEIRLLKLKAQREEGKMIGRDLVGDLFSRFGAKLNQTLTLKIETEVPARLVGKDIVAARAEARAVLDEIREICNSGIMEMEAGCDR